MPLADGALVAISALFTLSGAWLTWRGGRDRRTGIGLLAFFGLCFGISLWTGWQRARARRSATARDVEIAGGVWHRVRIGKFVATAVGVGAVLVVVSWAKRGSSVAWLALSGALACFALVPVIVFGPPGRRADLFEPVGLRVLEPKFEVMLPWDDIAGACVRDVHDTLIVVLAVRDVHDTLIVVLAVRDPTALVVVPRGCSVAQARLALASLFARSRAWAGGDVALAPSTLGLDAVLFVKAIETYVAHSDARVRLASRLRLPQT